MPNTVKLPGFGEVSRKPLIIGMVAAAAVGGYLLYRHHKNAGAAAPAATAYGYSASSAYGYAGYGYGLGIATYGYGSYGYGTGAGSLPPTGTGVGTITPVTGYGLSTAPVTTPVPPPGQVVTSKAGSGSGKIVGKRHVASGATTLNQWAKTNKTTAGEVMDTTEKNYQSGYMTTAHHTSFDQYLNKGTDKKMPSGLIFFSQK